MTGLNVREVVASNRQKLKTEPDKRMANFQAMCTSFVAVLDQSLQNPARR